MRRRFRIPTRCSPEERSRRDRAAGDRHPGAAGRGGAGGHIRPARPRCAGAGRMAADGGGPAGSGRTRERRGGWRPLSLAGRRGGTARIAGRGAPAGAVRSDRVGAAAVRASVGVGLPVRGLHQAGAAPVRLLRDAAAVGLRRHRLGQCQPQGWTAGCRSGLRRRATEGSGIPARPGRRTGGDGEFPDADPGGPTMPPRIGYLLPTREQIMEGRPDDRVRCWRWPRAPRRWATIRSGSATRCWRGRGTIR